MPKAHKLKKITLRFYNSVNLGDDLFVKIITDRYKDTFLIDRSAKKFLFPYSQNIRPSSTPIGYVAYRLYSRITRAANRVSIPSIRKSDIFVYIGGSIFMEGKEPKVWVQEENLYKYINIPYYIIGPNFGPYKSEGFLEIAKNIISNSEDICFRDQRSYSLFRHLPNARYAPDVAFTLDISRLNRTTQEKSAVISVIDCRRRFTEKIARKYEHAIAELTHNLLSQGYEVTFMSFCEREGDELSAQRISSLVGDSRIKSYYYKGNLNEALDTLHSGDIIIASRFHAAILGLLLKKRVLPIAYSDKTLDVLKDMDFSGPILDIREIEMFDATQFNFDSIEVNDVSNLVTLAEGQFQELDKVLTRKTDV